MQVDLVQDDWLRGERRVRVGESGHRKLVSQAGVALEWTAPGSAECSI